MLPRTTERLRAGASAAAEALRAGASANDRATASRSFRAGRASSGRCFRERPGGGFERPSSGTWRASAPLCRAQGRSKSSRYVGHVPVPLAKAIRPVHVATTYLPGPFGRPRARASRLRLLGPYTRRRPNEMGANPTTGARGPTLPDLILRSLPIPGRRRAAARGGPSKGMRQPLYGSRRSQTRAMARMPPLGRHVVATCTAESPWREDGHGADMSGELASPLRHAQWSTNGPGAAKGALERTTRPFAEAPARSRSVVRGSTRPQRLSGPRKPRPQRLQRPAEAPARSGSSGPRKLLPERARPSRKHLPERARPSRKLRPQSLSRSPEHPLAVAQQPQEHPPAVARSFAEAPARSGSAAAEAPPRSSSAAAEAPARTRSQRLSSRGSTRPLTDPRSARMRPWHSCITGMHQ